MFTKKDVPKTLKHIDEFSHDISKIGSAAEDKTFGFTYISA